MPAAPPQLDQLRPATLRDRGNVVLRSVQESDLAAMLRFLTALSPRSTYLRFCCGGPNLAQIAEEFTGGGSHRTGVVAVTAHGEIVAHAEYLPIEPGAAEVAVVVADRMQGLGLARLLIEELAEHGRGAGIERFVAEVLPSNAAMLTVFRRGFGAAVVETDSICQVEFGIGAGRGALIAA